MNVAILVGIVLRLTYAPNDEDMRLVETSLIPSICQCLGELVYI